MLGQLTATGAVAADILPQQGLKRRLLKHIEQKQLSPASTNFRLQASQVSGLRLRRQLCHGNPRLLFLVVIATYLFFGRPQSNFASAAASSSSASVGGAAFFACSG